MIQRIQSVFLFLSSLSISSLFIPGIDINETIDKENISNISSTGPLADGLFNVYDDYSLGLLALLSVILFTFAIFLFRNRSIQKRMVLGSIILIFVLIGLSLYYLSTAFSDGAIDFSLIRLDWGALLLPLSILLGVLAIRYINKDEKLVKSMDRLR